VFLRIAGSTGTCFFYVFPPLINAFTAVPAPQNMENRINNQGQTTSKVTETVRGPEIVLPIIEEQASIDKKEIETGTVRVTRHVSQEDVPVHIVLSHDECKVEHVPAGYYVEKAPDVRWEGDTMIVPVMREVAVVEKKLLLVEELNIRKAKIQESYTEQVTIRKEGIEITRSTPDDPTPHTL
jgi:uncharacterized protein (TIGR02271 family)